MTMYISVVYYPSSGTLVNYSHSRRMRFEIDTTVLFIIIICNTPYNLSVVFFIGHSYIFIFYDHLINSLVVAELSVKTT